MSKENLFGDLYRENVKTMTNQDREKVLGILLEHMTSEQIADRIKMVKLSDEVNKIRAGLLSAAGVSL